MGRRPTTSFGMATATDDVESDLEASRRALLDAASLRSARAIDCARRLCTHGGRLLAGDTDLVDCVAWQIPALDDDRDTQRTVRIPFVMPVALHSCPGTNHDCPISVHRPDSSGDTRRASSCASCRRTRQLPHRHHVGSACLTAGTDQPAYLTNVCPVGARTVPVIPTTCTCWQTSLVRDQLSPFHEIVI